MANEVNKATANQDVSPIDTEVPDVDIENIDTVDSTPETPSTEVSSVAEKLEADYRSAGGIAPNEMRERKPEAPSFFQSAAAAIIKIITNSEQYLSGGQPYVGKPSFAYLTGNKDAIAKEKKGDAESLAREWSNWQSVETGGWDAMIQSLVEDANGPRKNLAALANAATKVATLISYPEVESALMKDPVASKVHMITDIGLGITRDMMIGGGLLKFAKLGKFGKYAARMAERPVLEMLSFETVQAAANGWTQYNALANVENSTGKEAHEEVFGLVTAAASVTAGMLIGTSTQKIVSAMLKKTGERVASKTTSEVIKRNLITGATGGAEGAVTAVTEDAMRTAGLRASEMAGAKGLEGGIYEYSIDPETGEKVRSINWIKGDVASAGFVFGSAVRLVANFHLMDQNIDLKKQIVDATVKNSDGMFKEGADAVDTGGALRDTADATQSGANTAAGVDLKKADADARRITAENAFDLLQESGAFSTNPDIHFQALGDAFFYGDYSPKLLKEQSSNMFNKFSRETAGKVVAINSKASADYHRDSYKRKFPNASDLDINITTKQKMDEPLKAFAEYALDGAPKERAEFDAHVRSKFKGDGAESADYSAERILLDSLYESKGTKEKSKIDDFAELYAGKLRDVERFKFYNSLVKKNNAIEKGMGSTTTEPSHWKVNTMRGLKADKGVRGEIHKSRNEIKNAEIEIAELQKKIKMEEDNTSNVDINDKASVAEADRANEAIGAHEVGIDSLKKTIQDLRKDIGQKRLGVGKDAEVNSITDSEFRRLSAVEIGKFNLYVSAKQKVADRKRIKEKLNRNVVSRVGRDVNKPVEEFSRSVPEDIYNVWEMADLDPIKQQANLLDGENAVRDRIIPIIRKHHTQDQMSFTRDIVDKKINEDAVRLYATHCRNEQLKQTYTPDTPLKKFEELRMTHDMNLVDYNFANKTCNFLEQKHAMEIKASETTAGQRADVVEQAIPYDSTSEDMRGNFYLPVEFTSKAKKDIALKTGASIDLESKSNIGKARGVDTRSMDLTSRLSFIDEMTSHWFKGSKKVVDGPMVAAIEDLSTSVFGMTQGKHGEVRNFTLDEMRKFNWSGKEKVSGSESNAEADMMRGDLERATFLLKDNWNALISSPNISNPQLRRLDNTFGYLGSVGARAMLNPAKPTVWVNANQASQQQVTNITNSSTGFMLHLPWNTLKSVGVTLKTLALGRPKYIERTKAKGIATNNEDLIIQAKILNETVDTSNIVAYHSDIGEEGSLAVGMGTMIKQMREFDSMSDKTKKLANIATASVDRAADIVARPMAVTDFSSRVISIQSSIATVNSVMAANAWGIKSSSMSSWKYNKITNKDLKFEQLHPFHQSRLHAEFQTALTTGDFVPFKTLYAKVWTERNIFSYAASSAPRYINKLRSVSKVAGMAGVFSSWPVKNRHNVYAIGKALEKGNAKPFVAMMAYAGVAELAYLTGKHYLHDDNTLVRWGWNYGVMRTHVANMIYPLAAISRVFNPFGVQEKMVDSVLGAFVQSYRFLSELVDPNYTAPEAKYPIVGDIPDTWEVKDSWRGINRFFRDLEKKGVSGTYRDVIKNQLLYPSLDKKDDLYKDLMGE